MNSGVEQIVAPCLTVGQVIFQPLSSLSVMFVIYGIYVVIFGLSVHVLSHRGGTASKLYMWCTISLFVLATLYTGTYVWGTSRQVKIVFGAATTKDYTAFIDYLTSFDERKSASVGIGILSSCIMNIIADLMLIHRCYIIWQSRIMLYLLGFIAVVVNGIALGSEIAAIIGIGSNFRLYARASTIDDATGVGLAIFQVLLASLTGGRIWWISREARGLMGQTTDAKYKSIVAIIIESGVLYAVCLVGNVALDFALDPGSNGMVPFDFGPVVALLSGLAPTMIIVRVAYGKSVDSVQQMVSTLQFADAQANRQRSRLTVDLQLRSQAGDRSFYSRSDAEIPEPLPIPVTGEKAVEGSLVV